MKKKKIVSPTGSCVFFQAFGKWFFFAQKFEILPSQSRREVSKWPRAPTTPTSHSDLNIFLIFSQLWHCHRPWHFGCICWLYQRDSSFTPSWCLRYFRRLRHSRFHHIPTFHRSNVHRYNLISSYDLRVTWQFAGPCHRSIFRSPRVSKRMGYGIWIYCIHQLHCWFHIFTLWIW